MDLLAAETIAGQIKIRLTPFCERVEIAGSIRRKRPQVKDIEIVCIPRTKAVQNTLFGYDLERDPGFIEYFTEIKIIKGNPRTGRYIQCIHKWEIEEIISKGTIGGTQITYMESKVDIFIATPDNWGYIYAIRTGSADFSRFLAGTWVALGYKGIEGLLTMSGFPVSIPHEETLFDLLKLPFVPPEKRNQYGLPGG